MQPGTRLGPYEIVAPIGAGGMGEVYRARDDRIGREVAVKVLPTGLATDPDRLHRFEQEARAAGQLNHPNIVALYDVGTHEGSPYLVTELLEGQSLAQRIRSGDLTVSRAVDLAVQLAAGLAAAHSKGIVHRDLKPENVFVTTDGVVKVLDFGLAKLKQPEPAGEEQALATTSPVAGTAPGFIMGSAPYMAPEQARGLAADARSDIFSFGCVLYEMLSGNRAFSGDTAADTISAILTKDPTPLTGPGSNVQAALQAIVKRCLEKRAEDRFQSARDLGFALKAEGEALLAPPVGKTAERLPGWRPPVLRVVSRPYILGPVVLLVALATILGQRVYQHRARVAWARNQAIPEILRLADNQEYWPAFLLARQAEGVLGDDPVLARALRDATSSFVWDVKPEGAVVYARPARGDGTTWIRLGPAGKTPLRTPRGFSAFRIEHPQCETLVMAQAFISYSGSAEFGSSGVLELELSARGTRPPAMVKVPPGPGLSLMYLGFEQPSTPVSDGFWMDVHEVTNREFKAFVDAGGYRRREFWKHAFVKGGRTLSWEEAMALLTDATGRPGPAGWELSSYPEGRAEYPVTGVSWYEAAAFAESVGKRLPTVSHWDAATDMSNVGFFIAESNFSGRLAPVCSHPGALNWFGLYDLAGNAREWCFNATGEQRFTLGEAADGSPHYFGRLAPRPPLDRDPGNGFRCIKPIDRPVPEELDRPLPPLPSVPSRLPKPFSDAVWKTWLDFLSYAKTPLEARTELVDDTPPYWRLEKVSFTAAYGGERMLAYVFLPKYVPPPYQTVVFWPGAAPVVMASSENGRDLLYGRHFEYVIRDGRVVLYPVLKGTFERGGAGSNPGEIITRWFGSNDLLAMQAKDVSRSIDYLQSRPDIAGDRIGFLAFSWGAFMGPLPCAFENRIKAGILVGAGLQFPVTANWARRVTIPMQMDNGRFDYFTVEEFQAPLFQALATPPEHKRHLLWDSDHSLFGFEKEVIKANLEWFDRYLGPVKR